MIIAWVALLAKGLKVVQDSHIQLQRSHLKLQTSVIDIVKDLQEIHKLLDGIQVDYIKILQKDFDYLLLRKQVDYLILEKEKDVAGEIFANGDLNSEFRVYFREDV